MNTIQADELRKKKRSQLLSVLAEQRDRSRDLRFRLSGAQLKNTNELKESKKTIARILSVLREKGNTQ